MEQIALVITTVGGVTIVSFLVGLLLGRDMAETELSHEKVIFTHCICSHGFDNNDDCEEYVRGVRNDNIRANNRE